MSGVTVTVDHGAIDDLVDAAFLGAIELMEHGLEEAIRIVPIEEGTLGDTGQVTHDRATLTVQASFDTAYAVRQHEDPTLHHDAGRRAKYLEDPMLGTVAANAERVIGEHVRKAAS